MDIEKIAFRSILRHYWKKGLSARASSREICKIEGVHFVNENTAKFWFKRFNRGDKTLMDKPHPGRPSKIDKKAISQCLDENPNASTRVIGEKFGCHYSTISRQLNSMGYIQKRPRQDPHYLTENQALNRVKLCKKLLENPLDDRFWKRIITCDEKWVYWKNTDIMKRWINKRNISIFIIIVLSILFIYFILPISIPLITALVICC